MQDLSNPFVSVGFPDKSSQFFSPPPPGSSPSQHRPVVQSPGAGRWTAAALLGHPEGGEPRMDQMIRRVDADPWGRSRSLAEVDE